MKPQALTKVVKLVDSVTARDCQRDSEVNHQPGRLVCNERVGQEEAKGPSACEDSEAVATVSQSQQSANCAQDKQRRFFLPEPDEICEERMRVLFRSGLRP